MRKALYTFGIMLLCLVSCGQPQNEAITELKKDLAIANKQLPVEVSFVGMEKMAIVGNDYTVKITIDEDLLNFDIYMSNMKQNTSVPDARSRHGKSIAFYTDKSEFSG